MDYIIEFQRREQYDCDGNCVPKIEDNHGKC